MEGAGGVCSDDWIAGLDERDGAGMGRAVIGWAAST